MYGLEKKKGGQPFEFDLEKDLRASAEKMRATEKHVTDRTLELKNMLREGTKSQEFEDLGLLLHGYSVLPRVMNRIKAKK